LVGLRRHALPDLYVLPESQIVEGKSEKNPNLMLEEILQEMTSLTFRMVRHGLRLYSGCKKVK